MSTETWILIWQVVLYAGLAAFALLSVWVIVFGFGDIKRMFADLRAGGGDDA
jgi:hypothetical protein